MKNVFRIVASLDPHQALIIGAISCGDAVTLLRSHKVYISAGRRVGCAGLKKLPRPPDTLLVVLGFIPTPVHVQHELRVPVTIGHRVSGNAVRRASDESDKNLALRGR